MVHGKEAKISSLVYVVVAFVLRCIPIEPDAVGIYPDVEMWHRFLYPFFHANWLHLVVNCWALLSVVFLYDIRGRMLFSSYLIAASIPMNALSFMYPHGMAVTVGASGVIYALFGRYSFNVVRKWYYQGWMLFFIGIGFILPNFNAPLHLYCYLCGLVLAFLNKPVRI